jgi:hypothetical protein
MWTVASYLAAIGQIGTQLELPAHGGRPWYGTLLRACGVIRTRMSVPPKGCPSIDLATTSSLYVRQIGGMGNGADRWAPKRSCHSSWLPATPNCASAST